MNIKIDSLFTDEPSKKYSLVYLDLETLKTVADVINYISEVLELTDQTRSAIKESKEVALFNGNCFIPPRQSSFVLKGLTGTLRFCTIEKDTTISSRVSPLKHDLPQEVSSPVCVDGNKSTNSYSLLNDVEKHCEDTRQGCNKSESSLSICDDETADKKKHKKKKKRGIEEVFEILPASPPAEVDGNKSKGNSSPVNDVQNYHYEGIRQCCDKSESSLPIYDDDTVDKKKHKKKKKRDIEEVSEILPASPPAEVDGNMSKRNSSLVNDVQNYHYEGIRQGCDKSESSLSICDDETVKKKQKKKKKRDIEEVCEILPASPPAEVDGNMSKGNSSPVKKKHKKKKKRHIEEVTEILPASPPAEVDGYMLKGNSSPVNDVENHCEGSRQVCDKSESSLPICDDETVDKKKHKKKKKERKRDIEEEDSEIGKVNLNILARINGTTDQLSCEIDDTLISSKKKKKKVLREEMVTENPNDNQVILNYNETSSQDIAEYCKSSKKIGHCSKRSKNIVEHGKNSKDIVDHLNNSKDIVDHGKNSKNIIDHGKNSEPELNILNNTTICTGNENSVLNDYLNETLLLSPQLKRIRKRKHKKKKREAINNEFPTQVTKKRRFSRYTQESENLGINFSRERVGPERSHIVFNEKEDNTITDNFQSDCIPEMYNVAHSTPVVPSNNTIEHKNQHNWTNGLRESETQKRNMDSSNNDSTESGNESEPPTHEVDLLHMTKFPPDPIPNTGPPSPDILSKFRKLLALEQRLTPQIFLRERNDFKIHQRVNEGWDSLPMAFSSRKDQANKGRKSNTNFDVYSAPYFNDQLYMAKPIQKPVVEVQFPQPKTTEQEELTLSTEPHIGVKAHKNSKRCFQFQSIGNILNTLKKNMSNHDTEGLTFLHTSGISTHDAEGPTFSHTSNGVGSDHLNLSNNQHKESYPHKPELPQTNVSLPVSSTTYPTILDHQEESVETQIVSTFDTNLNSTGNDTELGNTSHIPCNQNDQQDICKDTTSDNRSQTEADELDTHYDEVSEPNQTTNQLCSEKPTEKNDIEDSKESIIDVVDLSKDSADDEKMRWKGNICYESYPVLSTLPKVNEIIAVKTILLDAVLCPSETDYRPAEVVYIDGLNVQVRFLDQSNEGKSFTTLDWRDVQNPRILFP